MWQEDLGGYDVSRFESEVKEDLLCAICQDVPKDPRKCSHKDHVFCLVHISRHLVENSETCPVCRDPLNQATLRCPTGFLKNCLDELKIKCDHNDRGCPEYVRLEHLRKHVQECGYAPVMCSNEGCGDEVNRRDIETHEKDLCPFRIAKCHDCKDIKDDLDGLNDRFTSLERKQDEVMVNVDEMNYHFARVEEKQDEVMHSIGEMREQFEKLMTMMNQSKAVGQTGLANSQDIVIIGGWYGLQMVSNSVEKYVMRERKSTPIPRLNHPRAGSASCAYNDDIFVVGGFDGKNATDKIEVLNMSQHPLRWRIFDGKLPINLSDHDVIVYQGKLYVTGGLNSDERKISDCIYEIALAPPYTVKLLTTMARSRKNHRTEIVNGNLFILGGTRNVYSGEATDNVVSYDLIRNEFKPCPSLPQPVCFFSTVIWGNDIIIVVGGQGKNGQVLNDVIKYNAETGRSERLPSMIYKRRGCSAVIMNDVIVVFGGWNEEHGYLNSVESLTIGAERWKELPGMMQKRAHASAVLKPLD